MLKSVLTTVMLVTVAITIGGCSADQSAEAFVKRDLMAAAKDLGAAVTELGIGIEVLDVSIDEKAGGVQDSALAFIEYLARCNETDPWKPAEMRFYVDKVNDKWQSTILRTASRGPDALGTRMFVEEEFLYLVPPCNLQLDPKSWEDRTENRRLMEKWHSFMTYYRSLDPPYPGLGTPGINHPLGASNSEALMLLVVGPSWPFVPERKVDLETWFGRPFTDEEIETFRTDPEMESQIVTMIAEQESQGKLGDKFYDNCGGISTLAEFYGMALNEQDRRSLSDRQQPTRRPGP